MPQHWCQQCESICPLLGHWCGGRYHFQVLAPRLLCCQRVDNIRMFQLNGQRQRRVSSIQYPLFISVSSIQYPVSSIQYPGNRGVPAGFVFAPSCWYFRPFVGCLPGRRRGPPWSPVRLFSAASVGIPLVYYLSNQV